MTPAQKSIRRTVRALRVAIAEVSRIHPEFATPKLLASVQKCARMANEAHIITLKSQAKLLKQIATQDKRLRKLERLARRLSNVRDDS